MIEISTQVFNVSVESFYKHAVIFQDSRWAEVAKRALDAFAANGLRPEQVAVRKGDEAFDFEISFPLFNRNANFRIFPDRLEIVFQNAVSAADEELIVDCIAKFYERIPLPEISLTRLSLYVHANLASIEAKNKFLAQFAKPENNVTSGGVIAYVLSEKWKEEFRITIDRSLVYPAAIFLTFDTQFLGARLTREHLAMLAQACEDAVQKLDLVFKKAEL